MRVRQRPSAPKYCCAATAAVPGGQPGRFTGSTTIEEYRPNGAAVAGPAAEVDPVREPDVVADQYRWRRDAAVQRVQPGAAALAGPPRGRLERRGQRAAVEEERSRSGAVDHLVQVVAAARYGGEVPVV